MATPGNYFLIGSHMLQSCINTLQLYVFFYWLLNEILKSLSRLKCWNYSEGQLSWITACDVSVMFVYNTHIMIQLHVELQWRKTHLDCTVWRFSNVCIQHTHNTTACRITVYDISVMFVYNTHIIIQLHAELQWRTTLLDYSVWRFSNVWIQHTHNDTTACRITVKNNPPGLQCVTFQLCLNTTHT